MLGLFLSLTAPANGFAVVRGRRTLHVRLGRELSLFGSRQLHAISSGHLREFIDARCALAHGRQVADIRPGKDSLICLVVFGAHHHAVRVAIPAAGDRDEQTSARLIATRTRVRDPSSRRGGQCYELIPTRATIVTRPRLVTSLGRVRLGPVT